MEFRILGPVEVESVSGRPVSVPRGRPLALLALLLLHRGAVVPLDRVVDELWPGDAPAHPQNAVQVVASRLRKALGDGVLVSKGGGYGLQLGDGALDAERFEELLRRGRDELAGGDPATAAETLREALAIWHGPALADVRGELFAQPEIARLEDLRLACISDRIDADVALGRHEDVVGELEALVAEHPLRERLRGQLMVAFYRSGRQADALAVYRDARRVLVDELGIEPSPELRELEQSILRQDPGTAAPTPMPTLPEAPRASRELRRSVTCLRTALAGSEELGRLDPEAMQRLLVRYHGEMRAACERHGAGVREPVGDALVAVFGAPVAHEDDAVRALRAALEMRERLVLLNGELDASFGITLAARTGVSTGEVVAPRDADSRTLVLGEAVNLATRLEQAAAPGEILLGEATLALAAGAARVEEAEPLAAQGMAVPARVYRLVELVEARAADAPLVGRARELRMLREAFDWAVEQDACQLVTVLGEPGIGKSRLARELRDVLGETATVLVGRCPSYGDGVTYWPVREIVEQATAGRSLDELVEGLEDGHAVARAVAGALGLEEGAAGEENLRAFRRLFGWLARERPLVLVVEDAHWGEPALLDVVDHLADWIRDAPVLIVCLARPELVEERSGWAGGKRNTMSLTLSPLSADESHELLAARAVHDLDEQESSRIAAAAGGNPLFLEQLLAHVGERGGGEFSTPPAIRALLAARLDLVGDTERLLLECGAVEGELFHVGSVLALAQGLPRPDAERMLDELVRRDLLLPGRAALTGEDAFRFRHALIRDAAYEELPKATRSELHERHADWLGELGGAVPEADARIGFHLERAYRLATEVGLHGERAEGLAARAGERLAASALDTYRRGDIPGQIGFLERAVDLLGPEEAAGVALLPRLAYALFDGGRFDEAAEVAERGVALADRLGIGLVRLQSEVECDRLRLYREPETVDVDASIEVAERAAQAFDEVGDDLGIGRVAYLLCELAWMNGRAQDSYRYAERVVAAAQRAGSGFEVAAGVEYMGWALVTGPTPAPQALEECLALQREFAHQRVAELAVFCAVLEAMMGGAFDRARNQAALARAHAQELGLRSIEMWLELFAAKTEMLLGDLGAAESSVRTAERIALEIGDRWFLSTTLVDLTHVLLAQDRLDDAEAALVRVETVRVPSDKEWLIKRHAARGKLAARRGRHEAGIADALRAVEVADTTDLLLFRANAHGDLAEVLLAGGRREEAARAATTSLHLHEDKRNAASAAQIRRFLAELA
jgi:DNA-binding SARP family transcriptional activator/class 3 adenylate cyclase